MRHLLSLGTKPGAHLRDLAVMLRTSTMFESRENVRSELAAYRLDRAMYAAPPKAPPSSSASSPQPASPKETSPKSSAPTSRRSRRSKASIPLDD